MRVARRMPAARKPPAMRSTASSRSANVHTSAGAAAGAANDQQCRVLAAAPQRPGRGIGGHVEARRRLLFVELGHFASADHQLSTL